MGCCFSEEYGAEDNETAAVHTPLLSGEGGSPPRSARQYRSTADTGNEVRDLEPVLMKEVKVANVDKRLKDHARLFNELLQRRRGLMDAVHEMENMYPEENPENSLKGSFIYIKNACRGCSSVTVNRRFEHCMEIEYDGKEVHYAVIPAFLEFNKANKLVKEIVDKGRPLADSVQLVLDSERELRRDVLVASLGAEGPDCMKNCLNNIGELQRVPRVVEEVRVEALRTFGELKNAAQILLSIEGTLTEGEEDMGPEVGGAG